MKTFTLIYYTMKLFQPAVLWLLLLSGFTSYGQWSNVQHVNTNSGNYRPRVALVRNGNPVVCWGNQTNGKIMFSRYNGTAFQSAVELNPAGTTAYVQDWTGPEIATSGDTIYVVFKMTPEATGGIYLVRSVDAGYSFSDTIRIDPANGNIPWVPSVTVDKGGNPVVAFMDNDAGWADPRYVTTKGVNLGNAFLPPVDATKNIAPGEVCDCCPATVLVKDSLQLVLFRNNQNNLRTIFASRSNDNGENFITSDAVDITNSMSSQCQSTGPDAIIMNDSLYTVWRGNSGGLRVYISSSGLDTISPVIHKRISATIPSSAVQNYPKIASEGNVSVLTWQETYNANAEVIMSYDLTGNPGMLGVVRDTVNVVHTGGQVNPDIAIKNGVLHIVWQDLPTGNVLYRSRDLFGPTYINDDRENRVKAGPNPFADVIQISGADIGVEVRIFDISGKEVKQSRLDNSRFVNCSDLKPGTYMVTIGGSKEQVTYKLIKSGSAR